MQPQEPKDTSQNVNATPPPLQTEPVVAPVAPDSTPAPTKGDKPPTKLIAIILGAVLLIAAGVTAYFMLFSGIKLSTYSNDAFSIQYPEGYEQKAEEESVTFSETGDKTTASSVFAYYSKFPEEIDQEQVDIFKSAFKEQVASNFGGITGSDIQLTDTKADDTKFKGQDAMLITGKAKRGDADAGSMKLIVVIDTKKLYMVGVGADTSDPGLAKATDTIINSFTIK